VDRTRSLEVGQVRSAGSEDPRFETDVAGERDDEGDRNLAEPLVASSNDGRLAHTVDREDDALDLGCRDILSTDAASWTAFV
jgi:hypothetical protein